MYIYYYNYIKLYCTKLYRTQNSYSLLRKVDLKKQEHTFRKNNKIVFYFQLPWLDMYSTLLNNDAKVVRQKTYDVIIKFVQYKFLVQKLSII